MVPLLLWAFDFFEPHEIWALRSLVPEKLGPQTNWSPHENHYKAFSWGPNFLETKFLGDQISCEPKKLGAQMR